MRATNGERLRCVAQTKAGKPCQAFASTPDGRCVLHGPRASEVQSRGGMATSTASRAARLMPSRLRPIVDRLEQVFDELYRGERNVREAMAMATVAAAIGRLVSIGELEERVKAIETAAAREHAERARERGR